MNEKEKVNDVSIFSVTSNGKVTDISESVKKSSPKSGIKTTQKGFTYINPPYNMDYLKDLYDFNSTHKFCIFLKTNLTCGLGVNIKNDVTKKIKKFLKSPNSNTSETFTKLVKKLKTDEEIFGRYCIEIVKVNDEVAFYHVPANEVFVVQDKNTTTVKAYLHRSGGGKFTEYAPYTKGHGNGKFLFVSDNYNPISRFYGVPLYVSSIKAIIGSDVIANYVLNFFANNARPDYFIIITGATLTQDQKTAIETKLTGIKGVENAHKLVTLTLGNPEAKVEIKEMSKVVDENFRNTKLDNRDEIAQIHGVPPKILGISSAGSLGSGNEAIGALKILVECIINPNKIEFEESLNSLIQNEFGFDGDILSFKQLSIVNEKDLAIIHKTYLEQGVMSVNEVREESGRIKLKGKKYDMPKEAESKSKDMDIENDSMYNLDPTKDDSQTNE